MALYATYELKDIAKFFETSTPHARVDYTDQRFFPRIANPPWMDIPTHELSSENGELRFKPIDPDQNQSDSTT
jgi:hypothetical protein